MGRLTFQPISNILDDSLDVHLDALEVLKPDILLLQLGALDLGSKTLDVDHLLNCYTDLFSRSYQEGIDLTVVLSDFRRTDGNLEVTPELYESRLKIFNDGIADFCGKFFGFLHYKLPGFDQTADRTVLPVEHYSTTGFCPDVTSYLSGTDKLVKGYRFVIMGLPQHLAYNHSYMNFLAMPPLDPFMVALEQARAQSARSSPPVRDDEKALS